MFGETAIHENHVIHRHIITLIAIVYKCEGTRFIINEQKIKIRKQQGQEMKIMRNVGKTNKKEKKRKSRFAREQCQMSPRIT